ncbi:MAG: HpaII family restriction endonuclease, partial [Ghiorsea sp.]|nr:HpaII family restriction endonuclease [Ghiorsea sp.]
NGQTFKIIRDILEKELGYSFHYQVVKASDYGLPQLRPRTFMIGFRNEGVLSNFTFPAHMPLRFTMSDVWQGECSREIGFTLRVGGRGSKITDRRNWDSYLVDGEIRKIMPEQARKMQGFPDTFEFPVSNTEAMKQLGNSVAIDAVRACATAMLAHMFDLEKKEKTMVSTKNKGEWTELYVFLKLLHDGHLKLADKDLNIKSNGFRVSKVTTLNIAESCYLEENDMLKVINEQTKEERSIKVSDILNTQILHNLAESIKSGGRTFSMPEFLVIQDKLGISIVKGGTSSQKADIVLDIKNSEVQKENEGFGIKSYLGSKPTLLNASGNTNFIFEVIDLNPEKIDEINAINTRTKLKDRISEIYKHGGTLQFYKIEKETMAYNLSLVDSMIPNLVAMMLLEFFVHRTSALIGNLKNIFE